MTTNIPKAREILNSVLDITDDRTVARMVTEALSLMTRTRVKRRAKVQSQPMTESLSREIYDYYAANPLVSVKEIANIYSVNQERVTEAIQKHGE